MPGRTSTELAGGGRVVVTGGAGFIGRPSRTAADHSLATRLLGWRPETDLADGLGDQIDAHVASVGGRRA